MTKFLYRLGGILIVWGLVALFGPRSVLALGGGTIVLIVVFILAALYDRYKLRRIRRKACDDAILYAQKKRRAFGEPDYTESELFEMKASRRKGDFERVHALILASNLCLLDKKQSENRRAMEKKFAARRRESEVGLYRA